MSVLAKDVSNRRVIARGSTESKALERWMADLQSAIMLGDVASTFTSGDATPSVLNNSKFITAGSTAITTFDDGVEGQTITIYRGASDIAINDTATIDPIIAGNLTLSAARPSATFRLASGVWKQVEESGASSSAMLPALQAASTSAGLSLLNGVLEVADIAALTALSGGVVDAVFVRDATRGGMFYWDSASSASGDSGTIFAPDAGGTGRWKRRYDGAVYASWFASTVQAGLTAAIAAGFDDIIVDANFTLTVKMTPSAGCLVRGAGKYRPIITKGFNGDMFDMSATGCALEWLELQGAGATYTGYGVVATDGAEQHIDECVIADTESPALHLNGNNAAQRCQISNSFISSRSITSVASIKITNTGGGETNGNRMFHNIGCQGGYFDIGDSAATNITGCNIRNVVFASGSKRSQIVGNRIATSGDALAIDGIDHTVVGNTIAGSVTLATGTQRCTVGPNTMVDGGGITDNSTASGNDMNVVYGEEATVTPVWGASGQDIGDGTISCRYVRQGRMVTASYTLTAGSTTNFGAGEWTFALPSPQSRAAKARTAGSAVAYDSSTGKQYIGVAVIGAGGTTIKIADDDSTYNWNASLPMSWAQSDTLLITVSYEVG